MSGKSIDRKVKINFMADTKTAVSNIGKIGTEADKTKAKLGSLGSAGKQGLGQVSQGASKAKIDLAAAAVAVQGMTSSIAGMAQQILDFDSKLLGLQKTVLGVRGQQLALQRQQENLTQAVDDGTISNRDYTRSIEDIGLAYQNMVLEQKIVQAETKKLDGEFIGFGINAIGTVAQVGIAFVALGITSGGVISGVVSGIVAIRAALTTILVHPVFLAVTAALLAWEFLFSGIAEDLTGIDDLSIFGNVSKAVTGLTEGPNSMEELDIQTNQFTQSVQTATPFIEREAAALEKSAKAAGNASTELHKLSVAQEMVIRNGGFRSGSGTSLSTQIIQETDKITSASIRTLAAASLHEALKSQGFSGDVNSRNISGSLNEDGFTGGFRTDSPLGGLGDEILAAQRELLNSGLDSSQIASILGKSFSSGAGRSSGATSSGFSGLTRSGSLSDSRGAGNGKRRGGRDRNPNGRKDKLSTQFRSQSLALNRRINSRFGGDAFDFTGVKPVTSGKNRRFGNNSRLSGNEKRNILKDDFSRTLNASAALVRLRIKEFRDVTSGAGQSEALQLLHFGFGTNQFATFDADDAFKNKIQDVIQARNFFNGKGVDFDGMLKSGVNGLLNIKAFGYRELNDQLAFQGQEQFQSIGT